MRCFSQHYLAVSVLLPNRQRRPYFHGARHIQKWPVGSQTAAVTAAAYVLSITTSAPNSRVQQALLAKPQSEINPYSALGDAQIGGVREMQFPFDGVRRLDADENLIGGEKPKPSQGCVVVVKDS
jgi:hypothetical protein